jgi:hypothetical protein
MNFIRSIAIVLLATAAFAPSAQALAIADSTASQCNTCMSSSDGLPTCHYNYLLGRFACR